MNQIKKNLREKRHSLFFFVKEMRKRFDIKWKNMFIITSKKGDGLILPAIVEEGHSVSEDSGMDSGNRTRHTCDCECECECNNFPRKYFQEYDSGKLGYHYEGPIRLSSIKVDREAYLFCDICRQQVETNTIVVNLECMCHYHKKCIDDYIRKNGTTCPACDVNFCRPCLNCYPDI
jgi:hypothetical protein